MWSTNDWEKFFLRTWRLLDASVSGGNAAVVIVNHSWIKALEPKLDTRGTVATEISTDCSLLFHSCASSCIYCTHIPPLEFCVLRSLRPVIALFMCYLSCQCFGKLKIKLQSQYLLHFQMCQTITVALLHQSYTSREHNVIVDHDTVETFVSSPRFARNFKPLYLLSFFSVLRSW